MLLSAFMDGEVEDDMRGGVDFAPAAKRGSSIFSLKRHSRNRDCNIS